MLVWDAKNHCIKCYHIIITYAANPCRLNLKVMHECRLATFVWSVTFHTSLCHLSSFFCYSSLSNQSGSGWALETLEVCFESSTLKFLRNAKSKSIFSPGSLAYSCVLKLSSFLDKFVISLILEFFLQGHAWKRIVLAWRFFFWGGGGYKYYIYCLAAWKVPINFFPNSSITWVLFP